VTARLRWSPAAAVLAADGGVIVRTDLVTFALDGDGVPELLDALRPLLDGSRDVRAVVEALDAYSAHSVRRLLDHLVDQGVVEEVPANGSPTVGFGPDRFVEPVAQAAGRPPGAASRDLHRAQVLMVGLEPWGVVAARQLVTSGIARLHVLDDGVVHDGDAETEPMWRDHLGAPRHAALPTALEPLGSNTEIVVGPLDRGAELVLPEGDWDLLITASAPDDLGLLEGLARAAHRRGLRSFATALRGVEVELGPGVTPGETACWHCARVRRRDASGEASARLDAALARVRPPRRTLVAPPGAVGLLGALAALEAVRLVSGFAPSSLMGRILTWDLVRAQATYHGVVRLPWCEVCGGAARAGPPSPALESGQ
jgi:bacteriocin biosynthesis cyclodehydratase domain-containing protein